MIFFYTNQIISACDSRYAIWRKTKTCKPTV